MRSCQFDSGFQVRLDAIEQPFKSQEAAALCAANERVVFLRWRCQPQLDRIIALALRNVLERVAGAEHEINRFDKERFACVRCAPQNVQSGREFEFGVGLLRSTEAYEAQRNAVETHDAIPGLS